MTIRVMKMLGIACLMAATLVNAAQAHHSVSMFDTSKTVLIEGTVKDWNWTNPHSWLQLMVLSDGKQVEAGYELRSPNALLREGFAEDSFHLGDRVRVLAAPRRDGSVGGMLLCVRTAEGRWLGSDPNSKDKCHD